MTGIFNHLPYPEFYQLKDTVVQISALLQSEPRVTEDPNWCRMSDPVTEMEQNKITTKKIHSSFSVDLGSSLLKIIISSCENMAFTAAIFCLAVCVLSCMNEASLCGMSVYYKMNQPFSALHW